MERAALLPQNGSVNSPACELRTLHARSKIVGYLERNGAAVVVKSAMSSASHGEIIAKAELEMAEENDVAIKRNISF